MAVGDTNALYVCGLLERHKRKVKSLKDLPSFYAICLSHGSMRNFIKAQIKVLTMNEFLLS